MQASCDEKILTPGHEGLLRLEDALYIQRVLMTDESVRRKWFPKKRKSYPLLEIARKALPEDPGAAVRHLRQQMDYVRRKGGV